MQGVCTVYSTIWEEETRKATSPVSLVTCQLLLGDTDNMIGRTRCLNWHRTVVVGRRLQSPILQPTDDDDDALS